MKLFVVLAPFVFATLVVTTAFGRKILLILVVAMLLGAFLWPVGVGFLDGFDHPRRCESATNITGTTRVGCR